MSDTPMTNEENYDAIVAPMLSACVAKCHELGFSMVARVEFGSGKSDNGDECEEDDGKEDAAIVRTEVGKTNLSAGQHLTHLAALSRGNFDTLAFSILREGGGENCVFLAEHARRIREKKETGV